MADAIVEFPILAAWVALLSVLAFGAIAADKRRAEGHRKRIRERTLLLLALAGGSPGLVLGMLAARHKTRKLRFLGWVAGIVALQSAVAWAVLWSS